MCVCVCVQKAAGLKEEDEHEEEEEEELGHAETYAEYMPMKCKNIVLKVMFFPPFKLGFIILQR